MVFCRTKVRRSQAMTPYRAYCNCLSRNTLTTAPRPTTAAAMARPTSRPLTLLTGAGAGAGGRAAGPPGGRGAGAPVDVGGRDAAGAGAGPEVGGRGGGGAIEGAGVIGAEGAGGGAPGIGAAEGGPAGMDGSLIVAVAEGFGGSEMRTVSFFGCTLGASPGRGGRPPGGGGGVPPMGMLGLLSAITGIFVAPKLGLGPAGVKPELPRGAAES